MNPYVFIVGCPRSATTLLKRMVHAHRDIAILPRATHWIPHLFEQQEAVTPEGTITPALLDTLAAAGRFEALGLSRKDVERSLETDAPVSYTSFVTKIFDLYARLVEKPLAGDKTPGYVRKLPTLHQLWPEARFLHLIRDGRDVALSILDWGASNPVPNFSGWHEDPISIAALFWDWNVRLGRADGAKLGSALYHEVRYESLVANPADECAAICKFLEVPYDDAMLRFHEQRETRDALVDVWRPAEQKVPAPVTSGLRDWRKAMRADELRRFEAAAGELLEELGYPREAGTPSAEALLRAGRLRDCFNDELAPDRRSRGRFRLEQRWRPARGHRLPSPAGLRDWSRRAWDAWRTRARTSRP
jgi:hypothetical protein